MTLSEMKTALKRYGFDDTDPLTIWLNWGMRELQRYAPWGFLDVDGSSLTIAGFVGSDTALKNMSSVRLDGDSSPLTYYSPHAFRSQLNALDTGRPSAYTIIKSSNILFYPIPDAAYPFTFLYKAREPALDDATPAMVPTYIPDDMHHLIVIRAAAYGLQAESEEDRANSAMAEFTTGCNSFLGDHVKNSNDESYVQDVMGYGN